MVIEHSRLKNGDGNKFNLIKWSRNTIPIAFMRRHLLIVALVVGSLTLYSISSCFRSEPAYDPVRGVSKRVRFGVVVDCGSTGTRAHIFRWKQVDDKITQIELLRDRKGGKPLNRHITPGLSSLRDNPGQASEYMEPIMDFLSNTIPTNRHADTPIHFMATAGLRLLDESVQKELLSDITNDLKEKFDFPLIKSQVISGEHEGIYSWLGVNLHKVYEQSGPEKSFGIIELGGASAQVTFELEPSIEREILEGLGDEELIQAFKNEQMTFYLSPHNSVRLFVTTFLGLGVNSARESAIDRLLKDHLDEMENDMKGLDVSSEYLELQLKDPCLTRGSNESVWRRTDLTSRHGHSAGHSTRLRDGAFKIQLMGSGDFSNCFSLLERVLRAFKSEQVNCQSSKGSCPVALLGSNFIPFHHYPFIGLSEMFFTTNEMMNAAGPFNRAKILQKTEQICSTHYNTLFDAHSHSGISSEDRILYECFKASWMLALLHSSGLNMPEAYDNYSTAEKLDGREIDWTIGAMVSEVALSNVRPNHT